MFAHFTVGRVSEVGLSHAWPNGQCDNFFNHILYYGTLHLLPIVLYYYTVQ